jgi:general secretion pathway protein I
MSTSRKPIRAFTLLEVVIALAILAVSLTAILDINAQAVYRHVYAKKLTVATLLARSKMVDLEQKLHDTALNADDEEDSGDFGEDGWPSFKWRAKIIVPKTNGLAPEQLFGALFNLPLGGGGDEKDGLGGLLGGLFGAGGKGGAGAAAAAAGAGLGLSSAPTPGGAGGLAALGPMAGIAQQQFTQMVDQLQKSVREVHLTVTWKEGKIVESIDLVTHVVSMGPGSDRNGGALASAGLGSGSDSLVRPDGTPAKAPQPCPSGQGMCDSDGTPLVTAAQKAAGAAAPGLPGGLPANLPKLNPLGVGNVLNPGGFR